MRARHPLILPAALAALFVGACAGGGTTLPDGGTDALAGDGGDDDAAAAFAVTAVSPATGPVAGGSLVVVSGRGFAAGATVSFGTNAGVQPLLLSPFQIKVTTPAAAGPGKVAVTVRNADNQTASLPGGFEYLAAQANAVDWCNLQWPASTTAPPGVATEPFFGRVWEQGCTEGASHCEAIRAELGYGPAGADPTANPAAYTWIAASYNATHTDDDNDEYVVAPTIATEGTYSLAYRFSIDSGATWTYCDRDGSGNGLQTDQLATATISVQTKSIGWCALQYPAATSAAPGVATESIFGQLFVGGCSEGDARCDGVNAEVGYGPVGVDPSADASAYTWVAASYNAAHTGDDNDEYGATLTVAAEGTYGFAYRFSIDGGATWRYCDLDGSDNGFSASQLGRLTVGAAKADWCVLQYPAATATAPDVPTEPLFGQVYVAGCTDGANQCPGVVAQVGRGPATVDPSVMPAAYAWTDAAYNVGHTGDNNDEYQAPVTVSSEGTFAYAYRFSLDSGATWTYCDRDGSANGVQLDQLGALTVTHAASGVDWCALQWPAATAAKPGEATEPIFGQVYVGGCTDGAAQCAGLTAEVGYGAPTADPTANPGAYTWTAATYNSAHTGDNNDEYSAPLTVPTAGDYAYAYRFSRDSGATWTYCDRDGSANGFSPAQTGALTVAAGALTIGWCILQSPATTSTTPGGPTETLYGRVFVDGCTDGAAQCAAVRGQVGIGSPAVDPQTSPGSYLWTDASYNAAHTSDANDEYGATVTPTTSGDYAYVYRFSVDSGATWSYCDRDSSENGLQLDQLGALTVGGRTIAWCNLQYPATITVAPNSSTGPVYGQVLVTGCTEGAARCLGLRAQLGFGAAGADPSTSPGSYTWVDATYNSSHTGDDNDEYQAALTPAQAGSYGYAFRFSGDGGATWSYCDTTGSPFASGDVGQLTVQ